MNRIVIAAALFVLLLQATHSEAQAARTPVPQAIISGKTWMAVNLETRKFRNGEGVPEAQTPQDWKNAAENKTPAWCSYNNDSATGKTYGLLYNWYAVTDPRGICPAGWRVPAGEDFTALLKASGGEDEAGVVLKSVDGWSGDSNGNNKSGFNARPAGYRSFDGEFQNLGDYGMWWSADKGNSIVASYLVIVNIGGSSAVRDGNKGDGYSIRCVKSSVAGPAR